MADVNVSVMADRTPITVDIAHLLTIRLPEGIETSFFFGVKRSQEKMSEEDATTQEQIFRVVYAA